MSASDFPARVVDDIRFRSGGICEGCGRERATNKHHRKYRSRGGQSTVENGLDLCGSGNHTGCHGIAHSGLEGERRGWAIRSGHDPAKVPARVVLGAVKVWVLLTVDGKRRPISDEHAAELLAEIGVTP